MIAKVPFRVNFPSVNVDQIPHGLKEILLLLFSTVLTYFLALELEKTPAQTKRKLCLLGMTGP